MKCSVAVLFLGICFGSLGFGSFWRFFGFSIFFWLDFSENSFWCCFKPFFSVFGGFHASITGFGIGLYCFLFRVLGFWRLLESVLDFPYFFLEVDS